MDVMCDTGEREKTIKGEKSEKGGRKSRERAGLYAGALYDGTETETETQNQHGNNTFSK
jgi:hypothetical protein